MNLHTYREYPLSWIRRHLERSGYEVLADKSFTILHSSDSMKRQIKVQCQTQKGTLAVTYLYYCIPTEVLLKCYKNVITRVVFSLRELRLLRVLCIVLYDNLYVFSTQFYSDTIMIILGCSVHVHVPCLGSSVLVHVPCLLGNKRRVTRISHLNERVIEVGGRTGLTSPVLQSIFPPHQYMCVCIQAGRTRQAGAHAQCRTSFGDETVLRRSRVRASLVTRSNIISRAELPLYINANY